MSHLQFSRTGPPAEVMAWEEGGTPLPVHGEVVIRMVASPVNPADLNFIEGKYGTLPELPCIPGMEGAGVIEAVGKGVEGLQLGMPVLCLDGPGNWAQWRVLPADRAIALPEGIDLQQAAMLRVNPATAWGLLHGAGPPVAGSWVVQNAGSSAAGHCVIQLAKLFGMRTITFVRRPESVETCRNLGSDLVFVDDADGLAAAKQALAGMGEPLPGLALNAVGGDSALRLLDLLGPKGTLMTYGAMGRKGLKVPNSLLIFKTLRLEGFWLPRWQETLQPAEVKALYEKLAQHVKDGQLRQEVAAVYPLQDWGKAMEHAAQSGRNGKVLFIPDSDG